MAPPPNPASNAANNAANNAATSAANRLPCSFSLGPVAAARAAIAIAPDQRRTLFMAERGRADFVYQTAALEGNPFAFPAVKTLLDGIAVGGHQLSDAEQVLRLNKALTLVLKWVRANAFELTATHAKTIQGIVAPDEALEWIKFRDGMVFIQGADCPVPPAKKLDELVERGRMRLLAEPDVIQRVFLVFLWSSMVQFFDDGNKRTSRFLCNAILLTAGHPPMTFFGQ